MLAYGNRNYARAARRAIRSLLHGSPFEVFVGVDQRAGLDDLGPRVHPIPVATLPPTPTRAEPFLLKFDALAACLRATDATHLLMMDADALLVGPLDGDDVSEALDGASLGMVEQTGIRGSSMARRDFLDHYAHHTLEWFGMTAVPSLDRFRFFNSGVVLGTREGFERLVTWARSVMADTTRRHQVGQHMIADQDYLQFWANSLRPGTCRELSWEWNHCEHWDRDFPRAGARILHFSNFCNGPTLRQIARMEVALCRARVARAWPWHG